MRKAGLLPILVVAVLVAVAVIAEAQQPTKVPRDPKDKDVILSTTTSTQD